MSPAPVPEELIAPLRAAREQSAILLDLDGTLAPVVRDPEAANVPELTRRAVQELTERYALVGCVTGRRAADARRILGIGSIPYAGIHGAELLVRGARAAELDPEAERWGERVRAVADASDADALRASGLRREDKGPVVALHWRGADDEEAALALAEEIATRALAAGLKTHHGRRVIELRPPVPMGKDGAVRRLLARSGVTHALYVGDDRTDIDAFTALRGMVADGRLDQAVCLAVLSDESPPELLSAADATVDGPIGVRRLLIALSA
ncbi:unannotated protein [freshwater metagenome]|uniref:trehalose-phosphatase n=1 Tax=freshwater metagenome TaxID=449393 RepID=A0A6J7DKJ5_9ZZZZ|nr:trehalose-phosphatase [Actinomycetota bacterium]